MKCKLIKERIKNRRNAQRDCERLEKEYCSLIWFTHPPQQLSFYCVPNSVLGLVGVSVSDTGLLTEQGEMDSELKPLNIKMRYC